MQMGKPITSCKNLISIRLQVMVKSVVVQAYLVVSESAAGGNMSNLAVGY